MATIKAGTYTMKEVLSLPSTDLEIINFSSISIGSMTTLPSQVYISSDNIRAWAGPTAVYFYQDGKWTDSSYMTWVVTADIEETDAVVDWFTSNLYVPEAKFVRLIREDEVSGGGSLTKLATPTPQEYDDRDAYIACTEVSGAVGYRFIISSSSFNEGAYTNNIYIKEPTKVGGMYWVETTIPCSNYSYPSDIYFMVQAIGDGVTTMDSDFASGSASCFIKGSLITLADGSVKAVEDIDYTDEVLAWNFDKGCFEASKIVWIAKEAKSPHWWKVTLSDGTILGLVGANKKAHRMFNSEEGKFIYPQDFTDTAHTFKTDGSAPTIVSCEQINEEVYYYNFSTENCLNQFVNGVLCGCRFSNIYPIKDMRFVKDDRPLRSREEFAEIPDKYFYGLRLAEQPDLDGENGGVQYHKTMKEHIIHNYIEHERDYQGEADYKEWLFRRKA